MGPQTEASLVAIVGADWSPRYTSLYNSLALPQLPPKRLTVAVACQVLGLVLVMSYGSFSLDPNGNPVRKTSPPSLSKGKKVLGQEGVFTGCGSLAVRMSLQTSSCGSLGNAMMPEGRFASIQTARLLPGRFLISAVSGLGL